MKFKPLYKRTLNNKISEWIIETSTFGYRTESGYVDGVRTTSEWYKVEPTNVGKSNARTIYEQSNFIAEKFILDKKKIGWVEDITLVDKVEIQHFQPMLATKWENVKKKTSFPVYVQPKLDGIRCIAKVDGLYTRNGKKIVSCPHIEKSLQCLFELNENLILDGELYNHELKHDFNEITSIVKTLKPTIQDLTKAENLICFYVYDVPSILEPFNLRLKALNLLIENTKHIKLVETFICLNESSLSEFHEHFVEEGFEGLMVRTQNGLYENKRSLNLIKVKTFLDAEYEIVGYIEGKASRTNCLQSFILKIPNTEKTFYSNMNASIAYLKQLWIEKENLIGKFATIKYFNLTPDNVPRFPKVVAIRDYE